MSSSPQSVSHVQQDAPTTQRVAAAAHEVIDAAAEKAEPVEQQIRETASRAGEKLEASQEAVVAQVGQSVASLENFVRQRPIAAAGIAFAAGVLATSLLRRAAN